MPKPDVVNNRFKFQLAVGDKAMAFIRAMARPSFVQLVLRIALAVPFWRSGILKWSGFLELNDTAVLLFSDEFKLHLPGGPYSFPAPELMAFMSGSVEVLAPIFLVLGLATRFAALTLLAMTCIVELTVPDGWPVHITWAAMAPGIMAWGPGRLSVDQVIASVTRLNPPPSAHAMRRIASHSEEVRSMARMQIVIVGAGFGGLSAAHSLAGADADVFVIDRHNYHLFQPLLYQVATAGLSSGDIATPIRSMFRERFNAEVLYGEVTAVDTKRQEVLMGSRRVPYDHLVLATGASHSYFGRDEWSAYAPGLKRVEDATDIRRRMLTAFELAETAEDDADAREPAHIPDRGRRPDRRRAGRRHRRARAPRHGKGVPAFRSGCRARVAGAGGAAHCPLSPRRCRRKPCARSNNSALKFC